MLLRMPRMLLLLALAAGGPLAARAQYGTRPALARRIDSLWLADAARATGAGRDAASRTATITAERARNAVLRHILETEGYPGIRELGTESCTHLWNLLQHADNDPALQRLALGLLRRQVTLQNAPGSHLAWLQDRVLVNSGQPQWYGTQVRLNSDSSSFEPRPVENPELLDSRRATVGLPPMAEYIQLMNRRYAALLRARE